jgi:RHS repeat-associated protein
VALVLSCGDDDAPAQSKDPRAGARRIDTLPAGTVFYSADHHETPLALTNAKGEVVAERRTFPYGSVRAAQGEPGEPYGFVGNELDAPELGLSDFHARPYDARLGIFIAPDPVAVFEPEKTLEAPLGLSAYAYALGNPITYSDPTGLCPQCVSDDLMKREMEMVRHPDPKVREAGRAHLEMKREMLLTVVPVPGGPAVGLIARHAPKLARLAAAARGAAAAKAAQISKAAGAAAAKGVEKVKGLVGGGTKQAATAGAARAARAAPRIGRSVGAAADITVNSALKNSPFAVRQAKALSQTAQRDVDSLLGAFRAGNTNPGIGTRNLGGGFYELRGANAGRVILHQGSANQFTIVGKFQAHVRGDTANSAIIQRLIKESGL